MLLSRHGPKPYMYQQQRINHTPNTIRAAAKINHQKAVGKTSDKIIINPAIIAIQPHKPRCPLRIKTPPPAIWILSILRRGRLQYYCVLLKISAFLCFPEFMLGTEFIQTGIRTIAVFRYMPGFNSFTHSAAGFF